MVVVRLSMQLQFSIIIALLGHKKKNCGTKWMNLKNMRLSERS